MKKRAFTVLEIIVICMIIAILASLGIPYYRNIIEKSKAQVCATNVKALQKAVDMAVEENDVVPATLAELRQENINKAFAELMREKGAWKRRLAFYINGMLEHGIAYAAIDSFYKLVCPSDSTPPPSGISYGINSRLAGFSSRQYHNQVPYNVIVVGDCDTGACDFGDVVLIMETAQTRHSQRGGFALGPVPSIERFIVGSAKGGYAGCVSTSVSASKITGYGAMLDPSLMNWQEIPSENPDCVPGP